MKRYILTLSLALFCIIYNSGVSAQDVSDSSKQEPIQLLFGKQTPTRLVGAVDVITGEELSRSAYPSVSAAMQALAPGYNLGRVRGYSRGGDGDAPLVIVDGLSNRFLESLTIEEVDSIFILKDVTAKMLYGSRAANGVIVVKTKRGLNAQKKISFTAEYGIRKANDYPEFVGAADYMKYNNQAFMNDGKTPLYSEEDIMAAGTDYKHPDVDYYDMFVNDQSSYMKFNTQLIGGDDKTKYFLNLGYVGDEGLEKVGKKQKLNTLNVRSNLDYKVNDLISVNLDIAGRLFMTEGSPVGTSELFSQLSTTKPNDYPMFISAMPSVDSLGTSDKVGGNNLYGDMVYSGYRRQITSFAQTNMGMKFDLNKYVNGLTGGVYATFDVNNYIAEGKNLTYRTLKPALTAGGEDTLIVNGVYDPKGNESRLGDSYYRNMGGGANLKFERVFGDHAVTARANYLVEFKTVKTDAANMQTVQDDKGMNVGLQVNYAYKNKYIAEMASSYMGSSRFNKDNRWKLYNSFGVSYIVSEEDFMKDVNFIDFLKVKASYGKIGYDQSFDYLLYNNYYKYWSGSYYTGIKNAETLIGTEFIQSGNPDLTFEESKEMNLGLTMRTLDNKLTINADYFTEQRTGMPTVMRYAYPQLTGSPDIVANYNAIDNKGYELSAQYSAKAGDLVYSVGGSLSHFVSKWAKFDELNDFSFQNVQGTETDAIWGYVADGFYTTADDIATYGAQNGVPLTSSLGTVIPGDLKLKDLSDNQSEYTYDDNVINKYDRTIIGNSTPRYIFAVNIYLKYKRFSVYALGQGVTGYDRSQTWPTYYTNKGNVKYSKFVYNAAVPTFDSEGNAIALADGNYSLPRLTTEGSTHSYNTSTFFLKKGSYFKLRTVELNYELPEAISRGIAAQSLNVFVRGDDLLTISSQKDLDPESPSAGLTGAPRFRTVSMGVKLDF